jgi:hypothetical protein
MCAEVRDGGRTCLERLLEPVHLCIQQAYKGTGGGWSVDPRTSCRGWRSHGYRNVARCRLPLVTAPDRVVSWVKDLVELWPLGPLSKSALAPSKCFGLGAHY